MVFILAEQLRALPVVTSGNEPRGPMLARIKWGAWCKKRNGWALPGVGAESRLATSLAAPRTPIACAAWTAGWRDPKRGGCAPPSTRLWWTLALGPPPPPP